MDTWATSSLTPQIVTGWVDDPDLFERTFPMDLRPQGPEIIRTWLFDTVVRARFEHGVLPWSDTTINGWVLDPDRKKMSKSKGNVVTPMPLVEEYGPDALRYWACNGRPAVDTAVDYGIMKIGRKLAIKILNASKFTLNIADADARRRSARARPTTSTAVTNALDQSMLAVLADLVDDATDRVRRVRLRPCARAHRTVLLVVLRRLRRAREGPRVRRGRVRPRPRRPRSRCAPRCRRCCASFAPIMPFVTEEVWSWFAAGSIHRASWPDAGRCGSRAATRSCSTVTGEVLAAVRKAKSEQKRSLMTPVTQVVVHDTADRLAALARAESDLLRGREDREARDRGRHRAPRRGRARAARRPRELPAAASRRGRGSTRT